MFADQVVVFSGQLSSVSRRDARALVQRLGGVAAEEVSARTTMLVIGAGGAGGAAGGPRAVARPQGGNGERAEDAENTKKIKKAEQVNASHAGRVSILAEADFCALARLPSPEALAQHYYGLRDIRSLYPAVREDHLRYLEKWGLIRSVVRTDSESYYSFSDLLVIKQVVAQVEQGVSFRTIVRSLIAVREGQLAFDFRPARSDASPAKVVTLEAAPRVRPERDRGNAGAASSLAARHFLDGSALDDGTLQTRAEAEAAYRRALSIDPAMVAALVNLANIHYARDELIEAQALYERAMGLEPDCFEAHFNLGNIHHDLGRYEDAKACYDEALALGPSYAEAHFYLAVTLEKMGCSQDAKPHWRAYRKLAPAGEWVELATEFGE